MAFKKGESGNPKGREAGKTPATALKKIIADNMPDILNAMIEQALAGDMVAAKALTDKVIPSIKPKHCQSKLPQVTALLRQVIT